MVSFKNTIFFITVAVVATFFFPTSNAQRYLAANCDDGKDNYTTNSAYFANLNLLILSLSINGYIDGYAEGTMGTIPDRVYGLVLCNGDINSTVCKKCLHDARQNGFDRCPFRKAVTIWYSDCLLRYSNQRFASIDGGRANWYFHNNQNVSSDKWPRFNQSLAIMLDKAIQYAAYNTSAVLPPLLFATGEIEFDDEFPKIYSMVQCTRDLSPDICNQCLREKIGHLKACCDQKIGGRVVGQSCYFGYEVYSFFGTPRVSLQANGSTSPTPGPLLLPPPPPPLAVPPPTPPTTTTNSTNSITDGKKKNPKRTILVIVIPTGTTFIVLFFCFAWCLRRGMIKKRLNSRHDQRIASAESLVFDLQTIRTATDNFSELNKLGEGGFGVVYKGNLDDGQEIAVKRLSASSCQGLNQLKNEIVLLAKLQHRNLVRVLGICLEEEEKLLIYEYVANRSLDTILFYPTKKEQLPWERRRCIIEGITRGMLYLHEESQIKIIHRDLKASNILLDAKMNPKISDFGLAKLLCGDQTHAITRNIVGTFGYISPEYAMGGQFSDKSDVFSFGVLIFEIVMVSFKNTIFFITVAVVATFFFPTSNAQSYLAANCDDGKDNYTTNSTYFANLNLLTSSLSINGSIDGYAEGTVGTIPDRVYGLVLCNGDINSTVCKKCLDTARQDVLDRCPFRKAVTIWYSDCLLRYSNLRFATNDGGGLLWTINDVNNISYDEWPRFNQSLWMMLDRLFQYAAYNTSALPPLMFATGEMEFDGEFPRIYSMVQCTRDLLPNTCIGCLREKTSHLKGCCDQRRGGRVFGQSCYFRYEVYSFFGTPRVSLQAIGSTSPTPGPLLLPPPPPPLAVPPPTPPTTTTNSTNSTTDGKKKMQTTTRILVIVITTGTTFIVLFFCFAWCLRRGMIKKRLNSRHDQRIASAESLVFDLQKIRTATDNFSELNKLGEGGFGVVYKGNLGDGQEIAVKRLSASSCQGLNQLKNEIVLLAKLQHRNLVRVLGICLEEEEKLLIYEYVVNRSLDTILFDPTKKEQLSWERRRCIIEGITRGMLYLHEESQIKIIHRDLKASNILLDAKMNPKISDFGLAKLLCGDLTDAITGNIVGTFGYMSPEYAMGGQFSDKSDVFSFGVLIFEIVTGRRNNDFLGSENPTNILSHVWEHWSGGRVGDIVDPSMAGNYSQEEALRCIRIGLLCVQENPSLRPTMSTVALMLSSNSMSVRSPTRPGFIIGYSEATRGSSIQLTSMHTPNDVSITELDGR